MLTKREAVKKLREWMATTRPDAEALHFTARAVSLTDRGYVSCWWNTSAGRCAVEWPEPYRVRTIRARKR